MPGTAHPNLTHLWILNTLFEERHISRTAERLEISQSTVSKAVASLRDHFDDPLLLRVRGGYQVTHKGRVIQQRLPQILQQLDELQRNLGLDPTKLEREFKICMADDVAMVMLPKLLAHFSTVAPGIRFTIAGDVASASQQLRSGQVDLVLESPYGQSDSLQRSKLDDWSWMCVTTRTRTSLTLAEYLAAEHGLVSFSGDNQGLVDLVLQQQRQQRSVNLVVPYFSAIPAVLAHRDVVFTVPAPLEQSLAHWPQLRFHRVPIEVPSLSISAIWHSRQKYDSVHRWIRDEVTAALAQV
ncbi:MAG: LysR family transcriptional regulator [Pseudomonadales bacterium]